MGKCFVEVHEEGKIHLINLNWVEEIVQSYDGKCDIYFAFNCPDAYQQDHLSIDETYEELKRKMGM